MEIIPILVVVDCASILANFQGGSMTAPTYVGGTGKNGPYLYMMAKDSFVINDRALSRLKVQARKGQHLRWSIGCLGQGALYDVVLSEVEASSDKVISTPECGKMTDYLFMGCGDTHAKPFKFTNYFIEAKVLSVKGEPVEYSISFQILGQDGKDLGFFYWKPIMVVDSQHKSEVEQLPL